MGKRMLHDRICESEKIDELSAEEERLYTRLLTHVDDYGNYPADAQSIRMACFPRKKKWNNRTIKVWLDRIVAVGLASYYEVQGQRYVHFKRFEDFQKLNYRNAGYPIHPADRGGQSMTGVVIVDDRGGHEGMTGVVMGDEGGGQVTEPALIATDANLKFLSKKEVSRSKPSPSVSNQKSPVSSARIPSRQPVSPVPATSKSLREWDEDIDATPAALIRRAIIYHYDHNPRDYHRSRMSVSHVRRKYQEMIDEVPENWEIPQPKTQIQYDPDCPKCGGSGGWTCKAAGRKIGRTWQVCECGKEVSIAAA